MENVKTSEYVNVSVNEELAHKLHKLKQYISSLGSLAVGFSGGVNSSLLVAVAHKVLGVRVMDKPLIDPKTGAFNFQCQQNVPAVNEALAYEMRRQLKQLGIKAIISTGIAGINAFSSPNKYYNMATGERMSYIEVLALIQAKG